MVPQHTSIIDLREKRRIGLKVLSPVHIGSREGRLTALEFISGPKEVHIIDEQKFGRFLLDKKLIDYFVREVSRGPVRMGRFLRERGRFEIPKDLPKIVSRTISGGADDMQDFRPFVRDGQGKIFFPGSSIKGVFRTAVLYRMMKLDQNLRNRVISRINDEGERELIKRKKFFSDQLLQKEQLQSFNLPGAKMGPNQDLLRCLTVRDAYPSMETKTQVIRIHFLSKSGNGEFYWSQDKRSSGKDLSIWVEAVIAGSFEMEISWDQKLFEQFNKNNKSKKFPVSSLDGLLMAVDEMNQDLVGEEKKFFGSASEKRPLSTTYKEYLKSSETSKVTVGQGAASLLQRWYEVNSGKLFRVGFGSGMLSTTVDLGLPPNLRQKIRDACGSGQRPGDPAPKSRRVWRKSDNECLLMGWMSMKSLS